MSFKNKVVLITGGSSGIGAAAAEVFSKNEAKIVIVGRNLEKLMNVAQKCELNSAQVLSVKANITNDEEAKEIVAQTIDKFGKLNVLVNNAGILREANLLVENFLDVYDEIFATNLRSVVRLTYFAAPHLIKSKGNIVNVSSVAATTIGRSNHSAYRSLKASLNHFSKCIAKELAPYEVRVNTVSPGPVKTDIFDGLSITMESMKGITALKKISEADEIAELIVYLASNKASSITGADYIIDNGTALK